MKYLKMVVTNPWIVLLIIFLIANSRTAYLSQFDLNSFVIGLLLTTVFYTLLDKLRDSIHRDHVDKLDRMSRASSVILHDEKGNEVKEDNEEYARGFREASMIILRDLK